MVQYPVWYNIQCGTIFSVVQYLVWYNIHSGTIFSLVQYPVWYNIQYGTISSLVQYPVWYNMRPTYNDIHVMYKIAFLACLLKKIGETYSRTPPWVMCCCISVRPSSVHQLRAHPPTLCKGIYEDMIISIKK